MIRVIKLGGSCLKDGPSVLKAAGLAGAGRGKAALVVSAVQGVTDLLLEAYQTVLHQGKDPAPVVARIRQKHEALANECLARKEVRDGLEARFSGIFGTLERVLLGISCTGESTGTIKARVLSCGERASAFLLAAALEDAGTGARVYETDKVGLATGGGDPENGSVDLGGFDRLFRPAAEAVLAADEVAVFTGFFGSTPDGKVSLFGRNGSDYSAAVIARGLGASRLEIWKDVPGFMTADPRLVHEARLIPRLSRKEAAELSYFGAKILHPKTWVPLEDRPVPVEIRSFDDERSPGTVILPRGERTPGIVKSFSLNRDVAVLRVSGPGIGGQPGIIGRIGSLLAARGINILTVLTSQTCINLILASAEAGQAVKVLGEAGEETLRLIEAEEDLSLLAAVGEGIRETCGVAGRIFSVLSGAGVNMEFFSSGASDAAVYMLIKRTGAEKAINSLHRHFFGAWDGPSPAGC
ncbi:MAG TPA: aspartate kinase [Candidatus Aminicenantes bacterium]|nr:aspartate kinase [Candidatus Aminicenantes bacterium]HRY66049.1 aspartate kinase [Candidatus Aminicenantes bacterium]HRZ72902.1 aspartate kinase [Candidatus Aminicenantes bacterium]